MDTTPLFDLSPLASLLLLAALLALGPLAWVWWRGGANQSLLAKRHSLTVWVLFLTFDLVVFGAFTRLTDSGLPRLAGVLWANQPLGCTAGDSRC